ncbi:anti-phage deoxyguanosine triphosphatase [Idiomarina sp. UBA4520]|jgi:dGTPase|uniref:anti-phage deoxyguanosine triphosphatase n=1 Tax=Idiomarina sp. UBA4520 TaxID=1946647 RepID=UPI000AE7FF1E|nr:MULTISPECIES: anti-phage deoxyguanosine triphosphatase [unclassified Idiomarina]|tara:strand:+ start:20184 stop:21458 length:1275 start_codon:yes stop_codon:yes gene_type:complete
MNKAMLQRRSGENKPFNAATPDSDAQRDRARIIHSSAFRRLQSKTQVLGVGDNDFYRTRLTHSMEVAQIGSGICEHLKRTYADNGDISQQIPSFFQIEATCLAHDLGHPPFGHGGEVALNYHMLGHGGFEGNGQTLRILSKLGEYSEQHGLDVTRRTLLGVLKYPVLHSEVQPKDLTKDSPLNAFKPPKSIHDDEEDVLHWILEEFSQHDRDTFCTVLETDGKRRSRFKAFDTSIMELADDISYGVHDLEDALALGLVTERQWREDVLQQTHEDSPLITEAEFYNDKLFSPDSRDRKHAISKLIGYLVPQISVEQQQQFEHPQLDLQATLPAEAEHTLELLKSFVFKHVIRGAEVKAMEFKGQRIIMALFEALSDTPEQLLQPSTLHKYQQASNPRRVICDYISGMTDHYARKQYSQLFGAESE